MPSRTGLLWPLLLLAACTSDDVRSTRAALGGDVGSRLLLAAEQEVATPRYGINPQDFSNPHLGVNAAGQYLIGYQDRRGDDSGWYAGDNVRLARMTSSGTLLDRGGIELAISGPSREQINLASDGTDYLVAWVESTDYEESKIVFARVGQDGKVLQAPTDLWAATKVEHNAPRFCFDGVEYRGVFSGFDNVAWSSSLYAARISKQGAVLSVDKLPWTAGKEPGRAGIGCSPTASLVAWSETDTTGAEVRVLAWPGQQALPGASAALSLPGVTSTGWVSLASGGGKFLAVWEEKRASISGPQLVGQLLSASAARSSPTDLMLGAAQATSRYPQLSFDGTAFRILTQELISGQEQALVTTVSTAGAITVPTAAVTSGDRHYPSGLACASGACLIAWTTGPALDYIAEATRLGATNQRLDNPALSISTPSDEQTQLRVATDQDKILFAWFARQGRGPNELFIRRQDLGGTWLEAAPVSILPGKDVHFSPLFLTALPGGGFALAYSLPDPSSTTRTELHVSFVSSTGAVTSPAPFSTTSQEDLVGLTCTATECLVYVYDYFKNYAYRLDHQGKLKVATRVPFSCGGAPVAIDSGYWCVAPSTSGTSGLAIARFDATLAAVGTPLVIPMADDVGGAVLLPGASDVTLAWNTASTAGVKIRAARVNLSGDAVLAGPSELVSYSAVSYTIGDLSPVALVPIGGKTFLLWRASDGQPVYKLRLQELSSSLALTGNLTELVPAEPGFASLQAAGTPGGDMLLAYVRRDSDPDRGSHRIKFRHTASVTVADGGPKPNLDKGVAAEVEITGDSGAKRDAKKKVDSGVPQLAEAGGAEEAGSVPDEEIETDQGGGGGCSCELASVGSGHGGGAGGALVVLALLAVALRGRKLFGARAALLLVGLIAIGCNNAAPESDGSVADGEPGLDLAAADHRGRDVKAPRLDATRADAPSADDAPRDTSPEPDAKQPDLGKPDKTPPDLSVADSSPSGPVTVPFSCRESTGDYFKDIAVLSDGSYVVAGATKDYFGADKNHALVARFSPAHNLVWQKRLTGADEEQWNSVVANADGSVLVAGWSSSFSTSGADAWVVKLDKAGSILWQKTYPLAGWQEVQKIVAAGDGSYLLVGLTSGIVSSYDGWLLKIAGDGTPAWQKSYGGSGSGMERFETAVRIADGYIVVGRTMGSFGVTYEDAWILRVDDSGTIKWQKRYDVSTQDRIYAAAAAGNGDIFLAGESQDRGWALRLKLDGSVVWQELLDNTLAYMDLVFAAAPAANGVVLAGYTFYTTLSPVVHDYDFWLIGLDGNGAVLWDRAMGGEEAEWATGLAATPAGDYLATGWTSSFTGTTYNKASWVARVSASGAVAGSCNVTHQSTIKVTTPSMTTADTSAVVATTSATTATPSPVVSQAALSCQSSCP